MKLLNSVLLLLFLLLKGQAAWSQSDQDPWATLSMVTKESKFDDMLGMVVQKATPLPIVEGLNGQKIKVRGYIIALAAKTKLNHFMFSRYPQNMCFFCGAAGPESAMQVFLKDDNKIDFTTDKVEIEGILNIQKGDASGLIYSLIDAELVRIVK